MKRTEIFESDNLEDLAQQIDEFCCKVGINPISLSIAYNSDNKMYFGALLFGFEYSPCGNL
ncbi:MAG: hypothetical protein PHH31_09225 [Acidaminococcaceae bacterium]|nr:hypothetical protein [Acidaminococcaceae bacterium]